MCGFTHNPMEAIFCGMCGKKMDIYIDPEASVALSRIMSVGNNTISNILNGLMVNAQKNERQSSQRVENTKLKNIFKRIFRFSTD